MTIGKRHALLWGPLFIFLLAFVLHVSHIFIMFAALGLLAPVSFALGRGKFAGIRVLRHGNSVMTAGERGTVTLTVRNEGRFRQLFLVIRDTLPDGLESPEEAEVLIPDLAPGEELRLQYTLHARRRGVYQVGPPTLASSDYLGLYHFTRRCGAAAEVLVYPRAIPIPNLWPPSWQGRRPYKSVRRVIGPSMEMFGLRDYLPGDDPRRVDWKASAHRNKLTVVETEHLEGTEAVILLDLDRRWHEGRGDAATVEYAATLAASLVDEALSRGCNVGLIADGAGDHSVPISSDPRQQLRLLEALARVQPDADRGLLEVLARHERFLPAGCSVAVISPNLGPEAVAVAARLRMLQHATLWFALDPTTFTSAAPQAPTPSISLGHLAAQGARVVPISGQLPLATNLWRRGRHAALA